MPSEFSLLARDPVAVFVAGRRFWIPYQPVAAWIKALANLNSLAATLMTADDQEALLDLIDAPGAVADIQRESLRILGEAGNRPWWEVGRLLSTSLSTEILGRMVLSGMDAHARTVGEWCAAVYALCVKGADEKGRLKFDFSLSVPPPGYEDEWDDVSDPDAVMSSLQGLSR